MPTAQKRAIKELIAYLKETYPNAKVVGHKEIGDSNCPGKYYPLEEMKNYTEGGETMAEFKDIQGHYAKKHIEELKSMGVVNGDENGNFRPNDTVTRADAAIMVRNAIRYVTGK